MPRQTFEQKLQWLRGEVLGLGYLVDQALTISITALTQHDVMRAKHFLADTCCAITEKRSTIETETLSLIATQQPVAGDLRNLVAVLEIGVELERIGNYASSIAQTTMTVGNEPLLKPFPTIIPTMLKKVRAMLGQALVAFERQDVILARAVPLQDDEVDQLYSQVYQELLAAIKADPRTANQATCLSRVAHNLERTADRVINICEWTIFAVTGEMKELNVSAS
jgi:phosphate transport system protein